MKLMLSAAALGAALAISSVGITAASAAPSTKGATAQHKSDAGMTDVSSRHRGWHGHRHWRGGPRYGYRGGYYGRPYGYGYGGPRYYGGYGYGGPSISFGFGGGPRFGFY